MEKIKNLYWRALRYAYYRLRVWRQNVWFGMLELGQRGRHCLICYPAALANPRLVFMHDYARLNPGATVLNHKGRFVMGRYSVASNGLSVVPDLHTPTVGIPHCCLGASHVHDVVSDVIVDEDVWIGMNVTLLGGSHLGRGSVVGANSLINKRTITPPLCRRGGVSGPYHRCEIQHRTDLAA